MSKRTAPAFSASSESARTPTYKPVRPDRPNVPAYKPSTPTYKPIRPDQPSAPAYKPSAPTYKPSRPDQPSAPAYKPSVPVYKSAEPPRSGSSYLRETATASPATRSKSPSPGFGQSGPESWKARKTDWSAGDVPVKKTFQEQIEEWFEQYFDEDEPEDDLYKSLGPQHDGEYLPPELEIAFDQGWDADEDSPRVKSKPTAGFAPSKPGGKQARGMPEEKDSFWAELLTNMNQADKPINITDQQLQSAGDWIHGLFDGNSLHSGENNGIKDYESIVDSIPDINALGAGGGLIRADEAEKRHQEQIEQRYQRNLAIENPNPNKKPAHINGQGTDIWANMSFGPRVEELYPEGNPVGDLIRKLRKEKAYYDFGTVANAGCEAIAVYNTLLDLDKYVPLSQIIYDAEKQGYQLWNGWFGTKIWRVDDMLNMYGVSNHKVDPREVQASADNGTLNANQTFVATIFNDANDKIGGGLHTFEIVYSPSNAETPWIVYNRYSNITSERSYATLDLILDGSGEYIWLHQINGG